MRLDQFVADVMEQLRDFVPEGGEVHFECKVSPSTYGDVRLFEHSSEEVVRFTARMGRSRPHSEPSESGSRWKDFAQK